MGVWRATLPTCRVAVVSGCRQQADQNRSIWKSSSTAGEAGLAGAAPGFAGAAVPDFPMTGGARGGGAGRPSFCAAAGLRGSPLAPPKNAQVELLLPLDAG